MSTFEAPIRLPLAKKSNRLKAERKKTQAHSKPSNGCLYEHKKGPFC
jgi:hypothetical protein